MAREGRKGKRNGLFFIGMRAIIVKIEAARRSDPTKNPLDGRGVGSREDLFCQSALILQ